MNTQPLRYRHTSADPISSGCSIEIGSHADDETAMIQLHRSSGTQDACGYLHRENAASAIVAIITGTQFLHHGGQHPAEAKLKELAQEFIDVFRETMVPHFREDLLAAVTEAETDWEAKCAAARIIDRYEDLR